MNLSRETVRRAALASALVGAAITGVGAVMATFDKLIVQSRWPLVVGGVIVIASVIVQTQASRTVRIDVPPGQWVKTSGGYEHVIGYKFHATTSPIVAVREPIAADPGWEEDVFTDLHVNPGSGEIRIRVSAQPKTTFIILVR